MVCSNGHERVMTTVLDDWSRVSIIVFRRVALEPDMSVPTVEQQKFKQPSQFDLEKNTSCFNSKNKS